MSIQAYRSNLETEVLTASPLDLVRMLYRGAIGSIDKALRHLSRGEIKARSNEINKACMILAELQSSVDRESGADLAIKLIELYDYAMRSLVDANIRQAREPLVEVQDLLKTLLEAWENVADPATSYGGGFLSLPGGYGLDPAEIAAPGCGSLF